MSREHDNGMDGYRCIHCGTNVNDWPDQPCMTQRERMQEKYLALAEKAEEEGDQEKADKLKLAAKRCE